MMRPLRVFTPLARPLCSLSARSTPFWTIMATKGSVACVRPIVEVRPTSAGMLGTA